MVYSKTILESNITPYQIGFLLGKWYNYLINRDNISNIINKYKRRNKNFDQSEINVLNSILKHFNKNQINLEETKLLQLERKINDYKKDKNLKDVCDFEKISKKVLEDKYTPKFKNNINKLTLNDIKNYQKDIEKNIKKNEKTISGEYFRQQFNKIFNVKIFDTIDKNLTQKILFNLNKHKRSYWDIFSNTVIFMEYIK